MMAVLGYTVIVTLLLSVTAVEGQRMISTSRTSQDRHAATQAAYAALNDYLARANDDTAYTRFAHVPAKDCAGAPTAANTIDPSNNFMKAGFWPLPGGASSTKARYDVDVSQLCTLGVVRLTAKGLSQKVEQTIAFTLRRRSFLDYTYFSDFEALDPGKYADNPFAPDTVDHVCRRHHYEPSASDTTKAKAIWPAPRPEQGLNDSPGCATINWLSGDEVHGPLHTNDAMLICGGPDFEGVTTTSYNPGDGVPRYLRNPGCSDKAEFTENNSRELCPAVEGPCYAPPLRMPPSNSTLKTVAGACVYSGPTTFVLKNKSYDVVSPRTPAKAGCAPGLGITSPRSYPYPNSGVVYVQKHTATTTCTQNPVGFPITGDITKYGCHDGDAFVEGHSTGRLTIGADDKIVVTDDLTIAPANTAPDGALGLVANSGIEIYHPVNATGVNLVKPLHNVQGSLLSVNGSVSVQNYNQGEFLGSLFVTGGMAQRWRGLIGTTDKLHGYRKEYRWDARLQTVSPPYFLEPVQAAWQVVRTER